MRMADKILVVDDEPSIVTLLEFNLKKSGYDVITATDGKMALEKAETEHPDLIVLDLMLPELDGMEVCRALRMRRMMVPILMLTARDEEFDKILGLELGADDYMTKPFSPREVVARVKAILRRTNISQNNKEQDVNDKIAIGIWKFSQTAMKLFLKEKNWFSPRKNLNCWCIWPAIRGVCFPAKNCSMKCGIMISLGIRELLMSMSVIYGRKLNPIPVSRNI